MLIYLFFLELNLAGKVQIAIKMMRAADDHLICDAHLLHVKVGVLLDIGAEEAYAAFRYETFLHLVFKFACDALHCTIDLKV